MPLSESGRPESALIYIWTDGVCSDKMRESVTIRKPEISPFYRETVVDKISARKALIVQGGTLWEGKPSQAVTLMLLERRWKSQSYLKSAMGRINLLRSLVYLKTEDIETRDAASVGYAYNALVDMAVTKEELTGLYRDYLDANTSKGLASIIRMLDIPKILITMEGSVLADMAKERAGFDYVLSNKEEFSEDGKLRGIAFTMEASYDMKTRLMGFLRNQGAKLGECAYVAKGVRDMPLMREEGVLSLSAPGSDKAVKAAANERIYI